MDCFREDKDMDGPGFCDDGYPWQEVGVDVLMAMCSCLVMLSREGMIVRGGI
jgi:hypothetical protein